MSRELPQSNPPNYAPKRRVPAIRSCEDVPPIACDLRRSEADLSRYSFQSSQLICVMKVAVCSVTAPCEDHHIQRASQVEASRCYEMEANTETSRCRWPYYTDCSRRNGAICCTRPARRVSHVLYLIRCTWDNCPGVISLWRRGRALLRGTRGLRGFVPSSSTSTLSCRSPSAWNWQELGQSGYWTCEDHLLG